MLITESEGDDKSGFLFHLQAWCSEYLSWGLNVLLCLHQSDVFDGSEGAAHYCKTLLEEKDLCNPAEADGDVEIMNSSGDVDKIMLCFELLDSEQGV